MLTRPVAHAFSSDLLQESPIVVLPRTLLEGTASEFLEKICKRRASSRVRKNIRFNGQPGSTEPDFIAIGKNIAMTSGLCPRFVGCMV